MGYSRETIEPSGFGEDIGGRSTQECLANSGANLFAAADLTLMRSAPKNADKNGKILGRL
jgi:hypothetical protein